MDLFVGNLGDDHGAVTADDVRILVERHGVVTACERVGDHA
jgi:hypothetical protein